MSQWDPNDPNNPYNQQWQDPQGQGQQGHGQSDQQWGQQDQQWQQPQQQWDQGQQQQWQQGQQQQWDQGQQQQWQQPQQQAAYAQGGQQGWDQGGGQQWQQPQQGYGAGGYPGGQQPAYGAAAYQGAYSETFGDTSDSAPGAVATLGVNERVVFLRKTYAHLFGAIVLFTVLEFLFLWSKSPLFELVTIPIIDVLTSTSAYTWLIFLGAFVAVGWVAERWAQGDSSKAMQYAGLGLYTLAESIIFIPLLFMAQYYQAKLDPGFNIIGISAVITLALFAGLTATVFITKKDFSFMRGILTVGAMAAMGIIVASIIFGFTLGIVFSGAMLLLAGGYVLYYTSGVLHHYRPNQYVAASLALFSAVALMFWYVVRIVMELANR